MKSTLLRLKNIIEKIDIPGIRQNELHDILDMTIGKTC